MAVVKQAAGMVCSARSWGVLGLVLVLAVVLESWNDVVSQTSPISLNTGLVGTAGSTLIAPGSPDDNWEVAVGTGSFNPAIVVTDSRWPAPFPNSRWISVNADKNVRAPARTPITYRFTFTLPTGAISPQLSIQLRADDIIRRVRLNGTQIFNDPDPNAAAGAGKPGSHLGPPLVINHSANFQPGPNQLDVVVEDVQAIITGLDVAGTVTYRVAEERVNLAITKQALNAPWQVGGTGAYQILVQNLGPGIVPAGTLITVTDPIPAGLTVTSAGGTGWSCVPASGVGPVTINCTRTVPAGGLPPSSFIPITIAVTITQAPPVPPGVFRNCASVRGTLGPAALPETSLTDNESCVNVPVEERVNLAITKRALNTPWQVGGTGTYQILVQNLGPGAVPSGTVITVTDPILAGQTVTAASGSGWICNPVPSLPPLPRPGPVTISCTSTIPVGGFPPGVFPPITITVTITQAPPPPGVFRNCASVRGTLGPAALPETSLTDNESCVNVPVVSLPQPLCCQHELILYNTLANTIKQVKIIPNNPQAITDVVVDEIDEDDWILTQSGNQYIIEPAGGGFFPADTNEALDADFAIQVDPAKAPTTVRIQWVNALGSVVKEEELTLECPTDPNVGEEGFDYDWPSKRMRTYGLPDIVLLAGAEPQECETYDIQSLECPINHSFGCLGSIGPCQGQTNILNLSANVSGATKYAWTVNNNSSYTGQTVIYQLPEGGDYSIDVNMQAFDSRGEVLCSADKKFGPICIPSADFSVGTPQLDCSVTPPKWNVTFTPKDSCTTQSYQWKFGDTSTPPPPGSGVPGPTTHQYSNPPAPTTYTCSLRATDNAFGQCTREKCHPVEISPKCEPSFRAEYELCPIPDVVATYNIPVKFTNTSPRFCASDFTWSFGDGGPSVVDNSPEVVHTYTFQGPNPPTYTVELRMRDSAVCPGGVAAEKITFQLKPVQNNSRIVACPDGETHFIADTARDVKWKLSGVGTACELKAGFANLVNDKDFHCSLCGKTVGAKATAEEEQANGLVKGTCTKEINLPVDCPCCDDFKVKDKKTDGVRDIQVGTKNYRMRFKHKVVNPTFGPNTRIVGKTKFKVQKQKLGVKYHKGIRAQTASVTINDTLRVGGPYQGHTCKRCVQPVTFNAADTQNGSSKAKYKAWVSARGVHQADLVQSRHYVKHKDGWEWEITVEKPVGNLCENVTKTRTK